ncbi:MAG TPA: hypothetical protein DCY80_16785 [Solibacterales bacterium]|nr:hypothetical protein [Bryobacterales bacterium]
MGISGRNWRKTPDKISHPESLSNAKIANSRGEIVHFTAVGQLEASLQEMTVCGRGSLRSSERRSLEKPESRRSY